MKTGKWPFLLALFVLVLSAAAEAASSEKPTAPEPGQAAPPLSIEQWLQPPGPVAADWGAWRGKVVVVEFWATWCGPCVAAIPHLNDLAKKFEGRPVVFVSLTDEEEAPVAKFLQRKPLAGWVGLDSDRSVFDAYGVRGIPHTVLVGPDGTLIAATNPADVTEAVLEEILAGKIAEARARFPRPAGWIELTLERDENAPPSLYEILIRPAKPDGWIRVSTTTASQEFLAKGLTLRQAIVNAYGVSPARLVLPEELAETTYDFLVRLPRERPQSANQELQKALETAFGLRVRRETREVEAMVLVAPRGRTPALREVADTKTVGMTHRGGLEMVNGSLGNLASSLEYELKRPVVDETGIEGNYDFELSWDPESPESVFRAVREQLGLELRPAKRPIEFLVVEVAKPPAKPNAAF